MAATTPTATEATAPASTDVLHPDTHTLMKMSPNDFADLRAAVARINDNALQPLLRLIVEHLGHTHGLDAAQEDTRIAKVAQDKADAQAKIDQEAADKAAKADEDARVKANADLFRSLAVPPPAVPATDAPAKPVDVPPAPKPTPTPVPTPTPAPAPDAAKGA